MSVNKTHSDLHMIFQNFWNEPNDHKNTCINYTILKYEETFTGHLMALTPAAVKTDSKGVTL